MESQFGKYENEVIKCWSQTLFNRLLTNTEHDFGLLNIQTKP